MGYPSNARLRLRRRSGDLGCALLANLGGRGFLDVVVLEAQRMSGSSGGLCGQQSQCGEGLPQSPAA